MLDDAKSLYLGYIPTMTVHIADFCPSENDLLNVSTLLPLFWFENLVTWDQVKDLIIRT